MSLHTYTAYVKGIVGHGGNRVVKAKDCPTSTALQNAQVFFIIILGINCTNNYTIDGFVPGRAVV